MADFETTTDEDDCRVWGWGLCEIETAETLWDVEIGGSIDEFITRISKHDATIYFHNLGFDGTFILDWLFRQGYEYAHDGFAPRKGKFKTLISNMGAFYSITVQWFNGKRTEFRDSYKKLPMSVSAVAEAYKMEEAKGSIDYDLFRPVGHKPTPEERHYIGLDVLIMSKALRIQLLEGATRLTVGSDALNEYKTIIKSKAFTTRFPVLADSTDREIRGAYRGGFTYVAERFKGKRLGRGKVYDVNSLYPSVMYDCLLPYGEPAYVEGAPEPNAQYPLFIASITFTASLKKNHIPVIQVKGSHRFTATEYQTEITEPITMMVSSVDLALWEEHYDLDIHAYDGAWMFKAETGMFTEYIDKWMEVKQNSKGGKRALAKLFLNALYGKFATNPDITGKYPIMEDDRVKLVTGPEDTRDPIYTAMGVFITAYARAITIRAAQTNYDVFAYCDTDSLHLLVDKDPEGLDVDENKLGAWKHEYDFTEALFVRAKTYIEKKAWRGVPFIIQHETHIAGLPVKVAKKLTMETLVPGAKFDGKLVPKRVPGGIVLHDVGFTVPVW